MGLFQLRSSNTPIGTLCLFASTFVYPLYFPLLFVSSRPSLQVPRTSSCVSEFSMSTGSSAFGLRMRSKLWRMQHDNAMVEIVSGCCGMVDRVHRKRLAVMPNTFSTNSPCFWQSVFEGVLWLSHVSQRQWFHKPGLHSKCIGVSSPIRGSGSGRP